MKASRGDLVVIERRNRGDVNGQGSYDRVEYEAGVVTSITREGAIKAFRTRYSDTQPIDRIVGFVRSYIVEKGVVDVDAAVAAAWANPWHNGDPGKPFDSLDEVKACVAPFKLGRGHARTVTRSSL